MILFVESWFDIFMITCVCFKDVEILQRQISRFVIRWNICHYSLGPNILPIIYIIIIAVNEGDYFDDFEFSIKNILWKWLFLTRLNLLASIICILKVTESFNRIFIHFQTSKLFTFLHTYQEPMKLQQFHSYDLRFH